MSGTVGQNILLNLGQMDELARLESPIHRLDARVKVLTTIVFLVCVVSFPKYTVSALIPFFLYPFYLMTAAHVPAGLLLRRLAAVSPLAVLLGIWNPLLDRQAVLSVGFLSVSGGWLSFCSILLRFGLTVGSVLILLATTGLEGVCAALEKIKIPRIFVLQILFLYRYLFVLMEEAARMLRARSLRSFGGRGTGLLSFRGMAGSLLLRTFERAERISQAMYCRAFEGRIPTKQVFQISRQDVLFFFFWTVFFIIFRWVNPAAIWGRFLEGITG
ncbi:MAG TPA: cobalt ECF transporter T component CbiQ [Anaerohalosphaeraceae bacterium]|nr:cobalt ECF transporter T component CbiQ [Anaerohalosphaeraceae bacterium]